MSRIAKMPVIIPSGTTVSCNDEEIGFGMFEAIQKRLLIEGRGDRGRDEGIVSV